MEEKTKYCTRCGKEILAQAVVCPHCGCAAGSLSDEADIPSTGLNIISLLLPFVGLILYLVYHEKTPKKANTIGKFALIGVGISVALYAFTMCTAVSML